MNDRDLALEIIARLNKLCEDPGVRKFIGELAETRINVPPGVENHSTIQVNKVNDGVQDYHQAGFLGLLNGIVGVFPDGEYQDWGYIAAMFSDETGELEGFMLTGSEGFKKAK